MQKFETLEHTNYFLKIRYEPGGSRLDSLADYISSKTYSIKNQSVQFDEFTTWYNITPLPLFMEKIEKFTEPHLVLNCIPS